MRSRIFDESGQGTVEAALVIPILFLRFGDPVSFAEGISRCKKTTENLPDHGVCLGIACRSALFPAPYEPPRFF